MYLNSVSALSKIISNSSSLEPLLLLLSLESINLAINSAGTFCRQLMNDSKDSLTPFMKASLDPSTPAPARPKDFSKISSTAFFIASKRSTISLSFASSLTMAVPCCLR